MLYLNSIENAEASPTEKNFAICHEEVSSMPNIPELVPSRELLTQWQSNTIDWEEFRERFTDEMRTEYRKEESRLKGLIEYSLENDVTLHSPEPSGEQTYRAILEGIINVIAKSQGQTGHVTNLVPEPVEEPQPQEDIASLFGNTLHELNLTKGDNTRLLIENAELKRDIQSFQTESHNKGKENDELKKRIDQLEEKINTHEATLDDLRQTLSEKDGEIQSLNNAIGERDNENDRLNRTNGQLQEQINTHETTIGDLRGTLSEKDGEIQSLSDAVDEKDRENSQLRTQITQLQDINTHPGIRDIAVEATGNDPVFGEYFRTLDIDENLPETLRNWLIRHLRTDPNSRTRLPTLIREYANFGEFNEYDVQLAHTIRTQRELIAYRRQEVHERTRMGRALCCFFAAALLSPKLPELEQPAFR